MLGASPGILAPLGELAQRRDLVWQLTKREVLVRYRGSLLGALWALLTPLALLVVYTFVFSVVFKARWNRPDADAPETGLVLFAGLIVFWFFSECVTRAPTLVLSNPSFVKKIVFPLEVLPCPVLGSALLQALISMGVLLLGQAVVLGAPPWTALAAPLVLLPLILLTLGIMWFLSSLGVYLRDIGQIVGVAVNALLFLSPIFYPLDAVPEPFRTLVALNPLSFFVEQTRSLLIFGGALDWPGLGLQLLLGAAVAWIGLEWFRRARRGFADVL